MTGRGGLANPRLRRRIIQLHVGVIQTRPTLREICDHLVVWGLVHSGDERLDVRETVKQSESGGGLYLKTKDQGRAVSGGKQ